MKEFDVETLAKSDGSEGSTIWIAYQGKVIDVTKSALWKDGLHMNRHKAGNDLTNDFQAAPHGTEVLERYPQIGVLKAKEVLQIPMPTIVAKALNYFPILRRHPHPMVVHFPIVFSISTTLFTLLFLATQVRSFEITALHCMGGGILFTPVGIITGWFTWWLNYLKKPLKSVTIKIQFSFLLLAALVVSFIWRIAMPDILNPIKGVSFVYLLLILSLIPLVTVIGWFGASLTFPVEKD
jgi:predicted heme/steroid binding protein/uncharacterized membrane protein